MYFVGVHMSVYVNVHECYICMQVLSLFLNVLHVCFCLLCLKFCDVWK